MSVTSISARITAAKGFLKSAQAFNTQEIEETVNTEAATIEQYLAALDALQSGSHTSISDSFEPACWLLLSGGAGATIGACLGGEDARFTSP